MSTRSRVTTRLDIDAMVEESSPTSPVAAATKGRLGLEYSSLVPTNLPIEEEVTAPRQLVADFDCLISPQEIDTTGDGTPDTVKIGSTLIPIEEWRLGQFNSLGQRIQRDDTQKVESNNALINQFNKHSYRGSSIGSITGGILTALTLGSYRLARRRVVQPGDFGHYVSSARHFLVPAGIHYLSSTSDKWLDDIPIDDEEHRSRPIGDKTILQVPENHIAGGFRIGKQGDDSLDQEFVLFSQGRHVLPESKYYQISVRPLDKEIVQIGPVTVLYVKEGFLGGAFKKKEGVYEIFPPGPPYLLHEQNYESISIVDRSSDIFKLGPYEFVTVKDGRLAGCYRKSDGQYQILPSGFSYQLHSKNYQAVELVQRTKQFKLGPFYFITVRNGWIAGAYRKRDGRFVILPPGNTYRLNEEHWREPVRVKRDRHIVQCGPLTFLTCASGTLNGAFQVEDGAFVEFEDEAKEYILHEKEFHSLVTIPKYTDRAQQFGPFKVITIRDGFVGLFERKGIIEIKDPGFYKVPAEVEVKEPIPVKVFQEINDNLRFRSKDGIDMSVKFTLTWNVSNPGMVARFSGSMLDLRKFIIQRAQDTILRLCKTFKRGELLPTEQDILATGGVEVDMADLVELTRQSQENTRKLYKDLEDSSRTILEGISTTSDLGIEVKSVQIDGFLLMDQGILKDLNQITKSQLATRAEKVEGELAVARAEAKKLTRAKQAEADAQVRIKEAEADAEVRRTQAQAEADARISAAKAENEAKVQMATADARASAESQRIRLEIETEKKIKEAEAEASAIRLIADAEHERRMKENEAASHLPEQQLQLQLAQLQVEMLSAVGQAAWQYPDVYTGFLKTFSDKLRMGPMTAQEALRKVVDEAEEAGRMKATSGQTRLLPTHPSASSSSPTPGRK